MIEHNIIFILYVQDQKRSKEFYSALFKKEPSLDVPGMTEFVLFENVVLGLMPEEGITKLLDGKITDPNKASGIARSEIYLYVDKPEFYYNKLIELGGAGISKALKRSWGDIVAYGSDLDGHILAFASKY